MARGILSILLGAAALGAPSTSPHLLATLVGAYAVAAGVLALCAAAALASDHDARIGMLCEGCLSIAAGILIYGAPGLTAAAILSLFAVWAILRGLLEIAVTSALRPLLPGDPAPRVSGMLSMALGSLLLVCPGSGLLAWLWIAGLYAIPYGLLSVLLATTPAGLARQ